MFLVKFLFKIASFFFKSFPKTNKSIWIRKRTKKEYFLNKFSYFLRHNTLRVIKIFNIKIIAEIKCPFRKMSYFSFTNKRSKLSDVFQLHHIWIVFSKKSILTYWLFLFHWHLPMLPMHCPDVLKVAAVKFIKNSIS